MKNILIISTCSKRGDSIGLIGPFLNEFARLDPSSYQVDLCNIGYFQQYNPQDYKVSEYYGIEKGHADKVILKIPKLRSIVSKRRAISLVKKVFANKKFDLVIVFSLPSFVDILVDIAHSYGCKSMLYPWGTSDLINRSELDKQLYRAFDTTDYVCGIENSNCSLVMLNKFHVPLEKYKGRKPFIQGVAEIEKVKKVLSREDMENKLSIPHSSCNIICGYNAYPIMLHEHIINSFDSVRGCLPEDFLLIFPMTYPNNEEYISRIEQLCDAKGLRAFFIKSYMTNEQVACLHLLSDLFINIQHADSGNAFQIEELYCGNRCITGKWLNYKQFELFGVPYYQIEKLNDLGTMLRSIFTNEIPEVNVPSELIEQYRIPADYSPERYWKEIIDAI